MKRLLKTSALSVLKHAGGFYLTRESAWRQNRLLILCYHGFAVDDEHQWNGMMHISSEDFAARLELLRTGGYHVLPLGDAVERLYAGTLPKRSVVITIDDGTYDFYLRAYPLLLRYNFPATVYLTTFHCFYNEPVLTMMAPYLLWKACNAGHRTVDLEPLTGVRQQMDNSTFNRQNAITQIINQYVEGNKFSAEQKVEFLQKLARQLDVNYYDIKAKRLFHIMTPEEVVEVSRGGIDIQLHTHRHRTPLDRELFTREITDNRKAIFELTGNEATHFCYPRGVYHDEFLPWLRELNVQSATTCKVDLATSRNERLLLPRLVDTAFQPLVQVESWLTGVASALPRSSTYKAAY